MIFKNQYYNFVAGLPDLSFEMTKLPFTLYEFRNELNVVLKASDKKVVDTYFFSYDNKNLLALLENQNSEINPLGNLSREELLNAVDFWKDEDEDKDKNAVKKLPKIYSRFLQQWANSEIGDDRKHWEDLLSALYMEFGMEIRNSLISRWFEFNLNIGNILTAIYARKYKRNVASAIVGDNEIANKIRENASLRDFGLEQGVEYWDALFRFSEEKDIYERERKIDKLRWDWLEEHTVFNYFDVEYLFAYMCKLQILERWITLNAEEGERVFREMIQNLKKEVQTSDPS